MTAGCDTPAVDTCADISEAAAGVVALENTATEPGEGFVTVGSVTDLAACVDDDAMVESAVGFGADFCVLDFGWVIVEVCFGAFVDSGLAVLVGLVVFSVLVWVLVLISVDPLGVDVSDDDGFDAVVSADATPCPVAIAVPTPNATASPPTRPMWAAAPMAIPP